MSTCTRTGNYIDMQLIYDKCNIITNKCNIIILACEIIMLPCDLNKLHVNIIIMHVDKIYLACRGQKYAAIVLRDQPLNVV